MAEKRWERGNCECAWGIDRCVREQGETCRLTQIEDLKGEECGKDEKRENTRGAGERTHQRK